MWYKECWPISTCSNSRNSCLRHYTLLMKFAKDNSAYSSSGGRSSSLDVSKVTFLRSAFVGVAREGDEKGTHPSKILLADTGPAAPPSFFLFPGSSSADTLKRSSTSPVFILPNPAFCCVTTEEAILSLKRCRLGVRMRHNDRCAVG